MESASREVSRAGRHIVVVCHPGPDSFNHALARTYRDVAEASGHEVVVRDLYAMNFDPVLKGAERPTGAPFHPSRDVADELEIIRRSDVFVLVYPIWFGSAPAMMKGYVDRVLGTGVIPEEVERRAPTSLLGNRRLLSFTTSALSAQWLDEEGQQASQRAVFDQYLAHAFGMQKQERLHFADVDAQLSPERAADYLQQVREHARLACAEVVFGDAMLLRDPTLSDQVA